MTSSLISSPVFIGSPAHGARVGVANSRVHNTLDRRITRSDRAITATELVRHRNGLAAADGSGGSDLDDSGAVSAAAGGSGRNADP
jgi:hypothetical protein